MSLNEVSADHLLYLDLGFILVLSASFCTLLLHTSNSAGRIKVAQKNVVFQLECQANRLRRYQAAGQCELSGQAVTAYRLALLVTVH